MQVSFGGIRGVWSRHKLLRCHQRLLRLETTVQKTKLELTDEQIRLLERFNLEFKERHIETRFTGDLVAIDTFFVGTLKGIDRVYMQSVIDSHSCYAWAYILLNFRLQLFMHLTTTSGHSLENTMPQSRPFLQITEENTVAVRIATPLNYFFSSKE